MSESEIRDYVREVLLKRMGEGNSEILSPEKKAKQKTQKLRSKLVGLMKVMDSGEYSEACDQADNLIDALVAWKTLISQVI